jgi:hypothetical protein
MGLYRERTLAECIDLFTYSFANREYAIRQMEAIGEWRTAETYWRKINRIVDADACKMIADAIDKGNEFRENNNYQLVYTLKNVIS